MSLPGRRGTNQWGKLPEDQTLVAWNDAATELGLSRQSIIRFAKRGQLQRHVSRRGVTRASLQDLVAKRAAESRRRDYLAAMADRIAGFCAAICGLESTKRDDLAFQVMRELQKL